jgi:hypothetical protein
MESAVSGSGWTRLRKSVKLIAPRSARRAWYSLSLYQLPYDSGFVIEKRSGPAGSPGTDEKWYRHSQADAESKYNSILRRKLGQSGPRQYVEVSKSEPAPDLF